MPQETLDQAFAAARASQRKEYHIGIKEDAQGYSKLRAESKFSEKDIMEWLEKKRSQVDDQGRPYMRRKQVEMLETICNRMCDELRDNADNDETTNLLLWCLHGEAGAGKSKMLLVLKELF